MIPQSMMVVRVSDSVNQSCSVKVEVWKVAAMAKVGAIETRLVEMRNPARIAMRGT